MIGEHKTKVNSALRFFVIGDVVEREIGWRTTWKNVRALETFVEEWKHEQELEAKKSTLKKRVQIQKSAELLKPFGHTLQRLLWPDHASLTLAF